MKPESFLLRDLFNALAPIPESTVPSHNTRKILGLASGLNPGSLHTFTPAKRKILDLAQATAVLHLPPTYKRHYQKLTKNLGRTPQQQLRRYRRRVNKFLHGIDPLCRKELIISQEPITPAEGALVLRSWGNLEL